MDYLYYSIYRWFSKTSEKDIAEYTTAFIIVVDLCFNIIVALGLMGFKDSIFSSDKKGIITLFIVLFLFLYLRFIKGKRYEMIEAKFNNLSSKKIQRMNVVAVLFILESLLIIILGTIYKESI